MIATVGPRRTRRILRELRRWGPSPAGGIASAAARLPDRVALIDEDGSLTFADLHRRSRCAGARARRRAASAAGTASRSCAATTAAFVDATLACAKLGADALYLNTMFAAPQIAGVIERERPAAIVHDDEFAELLSGAGDVPRIPEDALERLIAQADGAAGRPARARRALRDPHLGHDRHAEGRAARRSRPPSARSRRCSTRIPLRAEEPTVIAAPLFHGWGFVHLTFGLSLRSTYVLRRRFDPEATLRAIAEHRGPPRSSSCR